VSPRQNIDCADHIGVVLETAVDTQKLRLRLSVLCRDMAAGRTSPTGVLRRHDHQPATGPLEFIVQLPTELEPALIEDGFVQARPGPNIFARCFGIACR
jgi:hypothetical protein